MTLPVAILAGGLATRLHPLTLDYPKSMISIHGYPFIGWQLQQLSREGITSIVLCLGHKASEIVEFVGDGNQFGLNVVYSIENTQLGTGGAIKNAEHLLGEVFGVLYGDSYLPINYLEVFDKFTPSKELVLMTIYENSNKFDKSNVFLQSDGSLYYSKNYPLPQMTHIDYGFSVFSREAIHSIPVGESSDLSKVLEKLSRKGLVGGLEIQERFYEVGSLNGIVELEKFLGRNQK